jgi:hypothetical protein
MAESDSIYVAAEHRIEWMTLVFGLAGAVFVLVRWGWRPAAGVALGAALAWLNFRWLKQGVTSLVKLSTAQANSEHARVPVSIYAKFFGRFALLLVVVYAILSRSWLPVAAVLGGLFAVVAAVMIELMWELVRSRRETETHT